MFEASRTRASRGPWIAAGGILVAGALLVVLGGLRTVDRILHGVSPWASPVADTLVDHEYVVSPLQLALELETELLPTTDEEAEAAMAWADGLARELGHWLLVRTGTSDLDAAERALWAEGPEAIDAFGIQWAYQMRQRDVWVRTSESLSNSIGTAPLYVNADDAVLVLAHVAWRLDLDAKLVRSPRHLYLHLHEPGGDGVRGVEATCIYRVDQAGVPTGSPEDCIGPRLTFDERYHPIGQGTIAPPDPLPPGIYDEITDEELPVDLVHRLATRISLPRDVLEARVGTHPGITRLIWDEHMQAGVTGVWDRDPPAIATALDALAALRTAHPAQVPPAPDERLFEAALDRDRAAALAALFAFYEPDGPVTVPRNEVHAQAMVLDLEHRRQLTADDWNARLIPLFNWVQVKPDADLHDQLCSWGIDALVFTTSSLDDLMPSCGGR